MQTVRKAEPYTLLEYQSSDPRVFGVEMRPQAPDTIQAILGGIAWVSQSAGFRSELTFLVFKLPNRVTSVDICHIAECARAHGLSKRVCAIVSPQAPRLAMTMASLQRNEIAVLLGEVGRHSRFSDVVEPPLNGVMIDGELIAQACGDPHAASILDAIVGLANNLGLKSFANECVTNTQFEFALSAGVSYVSYGRPYGDAAGPVLPHLASTFRGQDGWAVRHNARPLNRRAL